ncbi:hypothetical protein OAE19_03700 [Porticoccaceae bacterium]|nr:hypothetical protein [Porticoccaceae bacterium]
MKRKLIQSFGNHAPASASLPLKCSQTKQRWLCAVHIESEEGVIDEYEIKPDRKLYLNDFLDIVLAEINNFDDVEGTDWYANIYRVTGSR